MSDAHPSDYDARRQITTALAKTLVVEAAAGTGKTSVLVRRILAVLEHRNTSVSQIAAVTFTDRAANELKLRLRAAMSDSQRKLLPTAAIGTIHALCGDILRQYPAAAGLAADFRILSQHQSSDLLARQFHSWFADVANDPPPGVRRLLARELMASAKHDPWRELMQAAAAMVAHRDMDAPWPRPSWDRLTELAKVVNALEPLAEIARSADVASGDYLAKHLQIVAQHLAHLERSGGVYQDADGAEAELYALWRDKSWRWQGGSRFSASVTRQEALEMRQKARDMLDRYFRLADAELAALLQHELQPVLSSYEAEKQRIYAVDFFDLLLHTRRLLQANASVRQELQHRFSHIFVDEFQDTDALQTDILMLLAADSADVRSWREATPVAGKLFVVGDPQQAIYRFRRADPVLYAHVTEHLLQCGAQKVVLNACFRCRPEIASAVSAAFGSPAHSEADSQAPALLQSARPADGKQPAVVALPIPEPYTDYGKVLPFQIERSTPDAVAAFVDYLVRTSGWSVERGDGSRCAIAQKDVCLLFRRLMRGSEDVTRPYLRALEARGLTHVVAGGQSFHEREEIAALRNALLAIEYPHNELQVYAFLRGPFISFSDEALFAYRHVHGALHALTDKQLPLFEATEAHPDQDQIRETINFLLEMHVKRNVRPISETLADLFAFCRAHAVMAMWPTGQQALTNAMRLRQLADRYEREQSTSFRSFVTHLVSAAEDPTATETASFEEHSDGVRLMSVHRAKGLEFPVVILCEPAAPLAPQRPSRYIAAEQQLACYPLAHCTPLPLLDHEAQILQEDSAEATRLLYVAATRARDLLVVPVVGDGPMAGWLEPLHPVLYPEPGQERSSERQHPGCPNFGERSVLVRPRSARVTQSHEIRPGVHTPQRGHHNVVWWDPALLELDLSERKPLPHQHVLEAPPKDTADSPTAAHDAYHSWQHERSRTLKAGRADGVAVVRATEAASDVNAQEATVITLAGRAARPALGMRFGRWLHDILAVVALDADAEQIEAVARYHAESYPELSHALAPAVESIQEALQHPLLQDAAVAVHNSECYRELPVTYRSETGMLVEGVIDLLYRSPRGGAEWVLLEFKTDRDPHTKFPEYQQQLHHYTCAIEKSMQLPVRPVLMLI